MSGIILLSFLWFARVRNKVVSCVECTRRGCCGNCPLTLQYIVRTGVSLYSSIRPISAVPDYHAVCLVELEVISRCLLLLRSHTLPQLSLPLPGLQFQATDSIAQPLLLEPDLLHLRLIDAFALSLSISSYSHSSARSHISIARPRCPTEPPLLQLGFRDERLLPPL